MTTFMVYHAGTGTYFGLDDGVLLIDIDTLTDEQRWELDESGEMPDGANGEDLLGLLPMRILDAVYPTDSDYSDYPQNEDEAKTCRHGNVYWFGNECGLCDEQGLDDEVCLVCGQPDNCGDCDHTPISPEAYGG